MGWVDDIQYWYNGLSAQDLRLLVVIGLGLLVFAVTLTMLRLTGGRSPSQVRHRISSLAGESGGAVDVRGEHARRLMERLGRGLVPEDEVKRGRVETRLVQAGFRSPAAVYSFYAAKILGLVLLPALVTGFFLSTGAVPLRQAIGFIGPALPIGLLGPDYWLTKRVKRRQAVLRRSLPDTLDMLVVCAEAGLGLNAAIQRVAEEMRVQHPELARELSTVMLQIRAGRDSRTALRDLVERTGVEEIRSLVTTLIQAMRFGTSVAATLRVYAEELRDKRLQAAEEEAAKVGVKMIIPIALLMLPAFMLIALGPPLIKLLEALGGE